MATTKKALKDILISDMVITDVDITGNLSDYFPLSGGILFGDLTISASNFKQTSGGQVYNFSEKNSFIQAEEAFSGSPETDPETGEQYYPSYGIACTGSRGYCILSVIGDKNALKLSGDLSMLGRDSNTLSSYSISFWQAHGTEIGTISSYAQTVTSAGVVYMTTKKPLSVYLANYLNKTEEENIAKFFSDDNAFYCPRNPLIGNQTIYNFYGNHAEGGSSKAIGKYSHAEGRGTIADVRYSHAEGSFTFAGGMDSHAEGKNNTAHGWAAHAEGMENVADGYCSHASGKAASALADNQFVWSGGTKYGSDLSSKTGTFCINPTGGLSGFYIGPKSIYQHMFDFGAATIKNDIKSSLSACFEGITDPDDVDTASLIKALSSIYMKVK